MASGSHGNDAVSSRSSTEETTATKRIQVITSTGTLTSAPQLPTLPFELIEEIMCRLPVKLLLQLRCLCKSFASLISDPNFKKKHLQLSNHHHLIASSINDSGEVVLYDSSNLSTSRVTQLKFSLKKFRFHRNPILEVCSCDGLLCIVSKDYSEDYRFSAILWNPSIRKHKILPPWKKRVPDWAYRYVYNSLFSFGYDPFIHNYKVIVVFYHKNRKEVSVHTLGTDHWRRIDDFPLSGPICGSGIFVSGNVNWLVCGDSTYPYNEFDYEIVSLNLEKESYKMLPGPDMEGCMWKLGVLRDCLCIFANYGLVLNVWIMKEYGKKESWTKLYSLPYAAGRLLYLKDLYIFEDDQMLVDLGSGKRKLFVYDSKKGNLNIHEFQNINSGMNPNVYIESLISPFN